jgi:hypothetical protein
VYYHVRGTCSHFVEMPGFAIRSPEPEQVFVPYADRTKAKKIGLADGISMGAGAPATALKSGAIISMGGLPIPGMPVKAEQVKVVIDNHAGALIIGISFRHMSERAGGLATISSDCLIDANIDPIGVVKKTDTCSAKKKSPGI